MPSSAQRNMTRSNEAVTRTIAALPGRPRSTGHASIVVPQGYTRDAQQSKVYEAENTYTALIRTRDEYPRVVLGGVTLDIPDILRFGDLSVAQAFADRVTAHARASRVTVRTSGKLSNWARYGGGVITLPLAGPDPRWAWTDLVLLHEIAHHLTNGTDHNSPFPSMLTDLLTDWVSPEAGLLLRVLYAESGVKL